MKGFKKFGLLVAGMTLLFVAVNCNNTTPKPDNTVTQNLTVKTVADTVLITGVSLSPDYVTGYELGAEVDFPANGPQPLTDSIRQFIIRELYRIFDWNIAEDDAEEKIHFPFEKVREWQGDNIVTVFINNYAPLYEKQDLGVGADYLNLKLVAQTETFVTYYAENTNCGVSCNYCYTYYTFRKRDGHLLNDIVPDKKWKKYVKANPQYEVDDDFQAVSFGMAKEGLLFGIHILFSASDGFDIIDTIPYSKIKPYLSKEAQELIPKD